MNARLPLDKKTRTRTRAGRLRGLDALLGQPPLHAPWRANDHWIEFGFGGSLATVLDLKTAMQRCGWGGPVTAVDQTADPVGGTRASRRVPAAKHSNGVDVVRAGFDYMPEHPGIVVRCMNVLRQYQEEEAQRAHDRMGQWLRPGGLLIEGSCCPSGSVLCAHVMRKDGARLTRWGLLFCTDFARGFAPVMFRDRLPRDLRRHCGRGTALQSMFRTWTGAWERTGTPNGVSRSGPAERFARAAAELEAVEPGAWSAVAPTTLLWTPPGGVPIS